LVAKKMRVSSEEGRGRLNS
jgi:hypothetical protein